MCTALVLDSHERARRLGARCCRPLSRGRLFSSGCPTNSVSCQLRLERTARMIPPFISKHVAIGCSLAVLEIAECPAARLIFWVCNLYIFYA